MKRSSASRALNAKELPIIFTAAVQFYFFFYFTFFCAASFGKTGPGRIGTIFIFRGRPNAKKELIIRKVFDTNTLLIVSVSWMKRRCLNRYFK
jgi:hypothetical protein